MKYYTIHYTDVFNGEDFGWDVVTEEKTNKIALFINKTSAEIEANKLDTEFRYTTVTSLELKYVDKNYYIIVDR